MSGEFVVNKASWHYRWIAFVYAMSNVVLFLRWKGYYPNRSMVNYYEGHTFRPHEFCGYWRAVLLWPAIKIGFSSFFLFAIYTNAVALGWGKISFGVLWLIALAVAVIVILAALIWVSAWYTKYEQKRGERNEPGFVKTLYRSYKNKYCPTVTYTKGGGSGTGAY